MAPEQYSHFDTAYQRTKGKLHFSFVIMMNISYWCAPTLFLSFRHLKAMRIKTTLHSMAPLVPVLEVPKMSMGAICFTSSVAIAVVGGFLCFF